MNSPTSQPGLGTEIKNTGGYCKMGTFIHI